MSVAFVPCSRLNSSALYFPLFLRVIPSAVLLSKKRGGFSQGKGKAGEAQQSVHVLQDVHMRDGPCVLLFGWPVVESLAYKTSPEEGRELCFPLVGSARSSCALRDPACCWGRILPCRGAGTLHHHPCTSGSSRKSCHS